MEGGREGQPDRNNASRLTRSRGPPFGKIIPTGLFREAGHEKDLPRRQVLIHNVRCPRATRVVFEPSGPRFGWGGRLGLDTDLNGRMGSSLRFVTPFIGPPLSIRSAGGFDDTPLGRWKGLTSPRPRLSRAMLLQIATGRKTNESRYHQDDGGWLGDDLPRDIQPSGIELSGVEGIGNTRALRFEPGCWRGNRDGGGRLNDLELGTVHSFQRVKLWRGNRERESLSCPRALKLAL